MAAYSYYCPKCGEVEIVVHIKYQQPILKCKLCLTLLKRAIEK